METPVDVNLLHANYIFARVTKCRIYGFNKTFSGMEATFEFTIAPTSLIEGKYPELEKLVVDVYLMEESSSIYLGRLKNRSIRPSTLNYAHGHQQQLEIGTDVFWKLADETHYKDLEIKLRFQALLKLDEPLKNSSGGELSGSDPFFLEAEGFARFPHSEWLKVLNGAGIERFDLIALRTSLPALSGDNVLVQAFDKLKEAQDKFNRGDWNAVGSTCRDAFSTVLSLGAPSQPPIKSVLESVTANSQRQSFGNAAEGAIDAIRLLLNYATHQGGNAKTSAPPANLQREDALLCLHLTAAAIAYITAVYK